MPTGTAPPSNTTAVKTRVHNANVTATMPVRRSVESPKVATQPSTVSGGTDAIRAAQLAFQGFGSRCMAATTCEEEKKAMKDQLDRMYLHHVQQGKLVQVDWSAAAVEPLLRSIGAIPPSSSSSSSLSYSNVVAGGSSHPWGSTHSSQVALTMDPRRTVRIKTETEAETVKGKGKTNKKDKGKGLVLKAASGLKREAETPLGFAAQKRQKGPPGMGPARKGGNGNGNGNVYSSVTSRSSSSFGSHHSTAGGSVGESSLVKQSLESAKAIVGTSTDTDMGYMRVRNGQTLEASEVRSLETLEKSYKLVTDDASKDDYVYEDVKSSLKSIRLHLKVQSIENAFTIKVYAFHGRLALKNDDLPEFNQCQNALKELFRKVKSDQETELEFACYGLLYNAYMSSIRVSDGNFRFAINQWFKERLDGPPDSGRHPWITAAMEAANAFISMNIFAFEQAGEKLPRLCYILCDKLLEVMRREIFKSWKTATHYMKPQKTNEMNRSILKDSAGVLNFVNETSYLAFLKANDAVDPDHPGSDYQMLTSN